MVSLNAWRVAYTTYAHLARACAFTIFMVKAKKCKSWRTSSESTATARLMVVCSLCLCIFFQRCRKPRDVCGGSRDIPPRRHCWCRWHAFAHEEGRTVDLAFEDDLARSQPAPITFGPLRVEGSGDAIPQALSRPHPVRRDEAYLRDP